MGSGKKFAAKVGAQGRVSFELNDKNSFTTLSIRSKTIKGGYLYFTLITNDVLTSDSQSVMMCGEEH